MSASPNEKNAQTGIDIEPEHQTVTAIDSSISEKEATRNNDSSKEPGKDKPDEGNPDEGKPDTNKKEQRPKTYYPSDDDIISRVLAQMVRESAHKEQVRKDSASVVDNTVRNDIYVQGSPPRQTARHERQNIGKMDRTDKNAAGTLQEERSKLNAVYLKDEYRQMYYGDVNLPEDMGLRFNQGVRKSKAFNETTAASLIKAIDMYKSGDADPQQEMMIMYKFGILLKNITDYKRSLIDEKITRGLRIQSFQSIDSWSSADNFSKTCISYGYVIPNDITITRAPDRIRRKAATIIFKQSIVFPGSDTPAIAGPNRMSYCALTFAYCGYHFVLFSKASTLRVPFRGSIAERGDEEVCITDVDNAYGISLKDLVEGDKAAVARQRVRPKMTVAAEIKQTDKTCTTSKKTNGKRTAKKATEKTASVRSYDISSWVKKCAIRKDDDTPTAAPEDTDQLYKDIDGDDNDIDSNVDRTTMIEMCVLVRNMATNETKQLMCYIKYRTYGVQIYLAYEADNSVYFFPIDNDSIEDYSVYWKR